MQELKDVVGEIMGMEILSYMSSPFNYFDWAHFVVMAMTVCVYVCFCVCLYLYVCQHVCLYVYVCLCFLCHHNVLFMDGRRGTYKYSYICILTDRQNHSCS